MAQKKVVSEKIVNAQRWNGHVKSWQNSGLTQKEYCYQNKISEKCFGYWLRKHRKVSSLQLIPVHIEPVVSSSSNQSSGLELKFANDARIEIARNFDSETFARVVRIIASL
ncbi:MAG: hypothetical protein EOM80_17135 [Erysipelotrichia bacterium]|nr:hypothetical protein [Erysipelotrichia bacterium]